MSVNINNFDEPNKVNVTNTSNKITVVDLSKKENTVITPSPKTTKVVTVVTAGKTGTFKEGSSHLFHHITASGNISASGGITALTGSIGGLTIGKDTEPGVLTVATAGKIEFKTALINFFNTLGFQAPGGGPFRQPFISASGNGLGLFSPDQGTFTTYGQGGNDIQAGNTPEDPFVSLQVRIDSVVIGVPYGSPAERKRQFRVEEANVIVGQSTTPADLTVHGGITGSFISSSQDIRAGNTSAHGLILTSPGGLKYRLKVSDLGVLSTEVVSGA